MTGISSGCSQRCSQNKYSQASHPSHPLSQRCSPTQSGLSSAHSAESSSLHWPTALADEPSSRCPSPGWQGPDHRPHPFICDDRLRSTNPLCYCPHPAGHIGRQRAAERNLVHGRTCSCEQERPVRFLQQHGKRPRDPRSDRFRRDRDSSLASRVLAAWGWRIPFLVGGILGLVGLLLRARADETPEFEAQAVVDKKSAPARLWALLREHPKALLQTAALSAPAVAYYTWATFLPTYAQLTTGRDKASTLTGSVIGLVLLVIIVPICGALSDRLGRRKIFPIIGAIGMVVLFYPLLLLLNQPGFGVYVLVAASGWVVIAIWQAVYPTIQAEPVPGLGPGIRHWFLASAGDRHLRWHRPADRRRVRRRGTSHLGRHLHDRHRRPLSHRLLHAPRDRQSDHAGHRSSQRPRGTGRREAGGLQWCRGASQTKHSP